MRGSVERTVGQALAAPVERRHREAARAQLAHRLEILLDELGAALEHADRAFAAGRRMPARKAQVDAVARLERARDDVLGHRIGRNGDEIHGHAQVAGLRLIAAAARGSIAACAPATALRRRRMYRFCLT